MANPANPFLVELFKDPRFLEADLRYVAERSRAMKEAQKTETTGMAPQNQPQAVTMRKFSGGGDYQGNPNYTDTNNYPLDPGIANLPVANASALANRQASVAMTNAKVDAKKKVKK